MARLLPPLSCNTSPLPVRPETTPPTVKVLLTQFTITEPTSPFAVPLAPLVTAQVWAGFDGWVRTVTVYMSPLRMEFGKVKAPFEVIVRLLPLLYCSTRPVPFRPETAPLI